MSVRIRIRDCYLHEYSAGRWWEGSNAEKVYLSAEDGGRRFFFMSQLFSNSKKTGTLPLSVTLDPMGNVYVADSFNHRIQFFESGQSDGRTIAGVTGVTSTNASHLYYPYSVVLDSQLNLFVADTANHRVQKFQRY